MALDPRAAGPVTDKKNAARHTNPSRDNIKRAHLRPLKFTAIVAPPRLGHVRAMTSLSILDYDPALAHHFRDINIEWIEEKFVVEPHDRAVLSDPQGHIIDPGGLILFVAHDGAIIGTAALMKAETGVYELTKMGVRPAVRGLKAGEFLLRETIARAKAKDDLDTLFLLTHSAAQAAIHLYEKVGFVHDAEIMARYGATYDRCNVAMRYPLEKARKA